MLKKILMGLLAMGSLSASAWSENQGMDLNACFQAALKQSEVLAAQGELIVQAQEHYRQALGNFYPYIYGYGAYFQQQNPGNLSASDGSVQQVVKLGLNQPLFRGFQEYAAIYQNRDLIAAQKEAKQWASLQLYIDVAQSFYTVIAMQKDLQDLDTQIGLYEKRIQDLNGFIRIGRSRPTEVLTVQAAQASLKAQRQQSSGQLDVARELLAFLTGLTPETQVTDTETWSGQIESLETYTGYLVDRPDVLQAKKQLEAIRENLTIARSGHWPSLDLSGNYYFNRTGMGASVANVDWDATLALTLPIFTGGITVSKVSEAESQVRQNELTLSQIERAAKQEIRDSYKTLVSDLAQQKAQQEAAVLAEKNYQAELRDYNYGLVTNPDVLLALSAFQDAVRTLDHLKFSVLTDYQRLGAVTAKRPEGFGGIAQ